MRWMIVAWLLGATVAAAKPTAAGRTAPFVVRHDRPLEESFECGPTFCADGELALVTKARALAAELNRRTVRLAPRKALFADQISLVQAYRRAVLAYDRVACCPVPTIVSVAALCERGALTDSYREVLESLPAQTDRLNVAIGMRRLADEGWRASTLREATCAYRAAASLAKRIGHEGQDLARARMAQRADEALLSELALRRGQEPKLEDVDLNCPEHASHLSTVWVD